MKMKVAQSCPTLCDPMYYTVPAILQARILEWVAFPFSRGIFPTQGLNPGLPHCRQITYQLSHKGNPIEHHRIQSFHPVYSKWTKTYIHKKTCTQLFIATSFAIAKRQKWLRCSSTSKCCNKLYDLSIEYHSIRKETDYWYKIWPG